MRTTVRIANSRSKTIIVSFLYEESLILTRKQIAEQCLLTDGWKITSPSKGDARIFDFRIQRDEDFKFCRACLITRFYVTTANKVGAQAGYSRLTDRQIECGVERLYYFPDGTYSWSLEDLVNQMRSRVLKAAHR